jgi:hypothetical protein
MSGEIIDGVVRPGPPPADAVRPAVVICDEQGEVRQAVVRLDDGTLVEVTAPDPSTIGPVLIEPDPWAPDVSAFNFDWRMRDSFAAHLLNPRDLARRRMAAPQPPLVDGQVSRGSSPRTTP